MPRNYVRKTDRGSTPLEELMMAVAEVKGGKSIRKVAKERMIDRSTLRRYLQKEEMKDEDEKTLTAGYQGTAEAKKIFREDMEKLLADHIRLFGLTSKKCRKLAFELAKMNNIPVPNNWTANGLAGESHYTGQVWFRPTEGNKKEKINKHIP